GPLQTGQIKGVAVFTRERLAALPHAPTAREERLGFQASSRVRVWGAQRRPGPRTRQRDGAAAAPIATPSRQERTRAPGTYVVPPEKRSTEYFESIIGPEIEKNAGPLKAAGISVD